MTDQLQLGDRAKCRITGFSGIVVSITHWLNGCRRLGVQPEELKDAKPGETQHFDDEQLEIVKRAVHKPVVMEKKAAPAAKPSRTGGPSRESGNFRR